MHMGDLLTALGDLLTALIDVIELVLAIAFVKALIKLFDVTNKK